MHRTYRYRSHTRAHTHTTMFTRSAAIQIPLAIKGLTLIFFLCVVIRLCSALGADSASKQYMSSLVANERIVDGILNFELGAFGQSSKSITLSSLLLDSSILTHDSPAVDLADISSPEPSAAEASVNEVNTDSDDASLYYNSWSIPNYNTGSKPNIITKPAQTTSKDAIAVNNKTDYSVDTAALLKEPLNISLSGDSPVVLIIHTHSSEAYMPDGTDQYVESDPYRTENKAQNLVRVGDEFCAELAKKGIAFIHDRGVYDYPSYNGSYNRSLDAIKSYLEKYPSIKMVIDMHRDAIEDKDKNVYKTIATVGDTTCSQVLLVMGTNFSGLQHPNWRENFKLALHIQNKMNTLYPSLAKPIELSQYRYNQQATTGSMIVEIGCTGNTLQESLAAARYFANAFSNVVLDLYK